MRGRSKLSDLVGEAGAFELGQPEGGRLRIRAKPASPLSKIAETLTRLQAQSDIGMPARCVGQPRRFDYMRSVILA